jgi:hypothetical protein
MWAEGWRLAGQVCDIGNAWAYLDRVYGDRQLDVLVVFWEVILRVMRQWGRREECKGTYLAREREEVDCDRAAAASCQWCCL